MQATTSLYSYAKDNLEHKAALSIVKKEAMQKIILFAGILCCLALAVNI